MGLSSTLAGLAALWQPTPRQPKTENAAAGKWTAATPEQLGDAAVPEQHGADSAVAGYVVHGADTPVPDHAVLAPIGQRRYRARPTYAVSPYPAGPATNSAQSPIPGEHAHAGPVDPRDQWGGGAGMTGAAFEGLRPAGEEMTVSPGGESYGARSATAAPSTFRAGSTGADPTRPSRRPFWSYIRAFDQMAVYGQGSAVGKLPIQIGVGLPLRYDSAPAGAVPSPGGSAPTALAGIGPQPNSFRLLPNSWAQNAVNTGGPASDVVGDAGLAAVAGRRAPCWRAR